MGILYPKNGHFLNSALHFFQKNVLFFKNVMYFCNVKPT